MSQYIQANTNGELHDAQAPSIAPLDRGFLYGDSVYEVFRTYDGVLFAFDEHMDRLQRSASALGLEIPFDKGVLLTEIRRTASAYFEKTGEKTDLYIRLQISRGGGPIGMDVALADSPLYILLVQPLQELPAETWKKGLRLSMAKMLYRNPPNALNPAWKTGNYLNNVLCLREARLRGADDVVILNQEGAIAEASASNIFFINNDSLITPPVSAGILEGITRRIVLNQAVLAWKLEAVEEPVFPAQLDEFDECFITLTTRDIVPVGKIDGISFRVAKRSLTSRLKKKFAEYVERHNERNKEREIF